MVSMASPKDGADSGCWWAPQVEDHAAYVEALSQERLIDQLDVFEEGMAYVDP